MPVAVIEWVLVVFLLSAAFLFICWGIVLLSGVTWDSLKSRGRLPLFLLKRGEPGDESAGTPRRDIPAQMQELNTEGRCYSLCRLEVLEEAFDGVPDKNRNEAIERIAYSVIPGSTRDRDRTSKCAASEFLILYPDTPVEGAQMAMSRVKTRAGQALERSGVKAPAERFIRGEIEFTPGTVLDRPDERQLRGSAN